MVRTQGSRFGGRYARNLGQEIEGKTSCSAANTTLNNRQTPEIGIPPSDRATRRYTKVHLDFCLRPSTLIGQIGRVPLFGAGPRRYIRSRLFRLAVTVFWRALTASWRQKGKRKQVFPRAIRTTELPSNPSPLTFRNSQIQILQTQPWQPTSLSKLPTHTARGCHTHARTYNARQRDKGPDSPATPSRTVDSESGHGQRGTEIESGSGQRGAEIESENGQEGGRLTFKMLSAVQRVRVRAVNAVKN